ncbi:MAG: hypothetical protein ACMUEM_02145 [Flavobacteriales bacterium AspAUS03]
MANNRLWRDVTSCEGGGGSEESLEEFQMMYGKSQEIKPLPCIVCEEKEKTIQLQKKQSEVRERMLSDKNKQIEEKKSNLE